MSETHAHRVKNPPVVMNCNGIFFEERYHDEAFKMPQHSHEEPHMAFLCQGNIQNFKGRKTTIASRQMLMYMPPDETHATQYSDRVHALYIVFSSAWWERLPKGISGLEKSCEYQNSLPASLALRIYQEFQKRDNLTPLLLEGLTLELLVAMSRSENDSAQGGTPRWVIHAQDYLHAHFMDRFSIDSIASAVGVHPGHLMRGFRHHFQCTIGDYVRELRVRHACGLIKDSEQSLAEISLMVGFSDQSHFCKTFKNVTGMTPTEWQNSFNRAI